MAEIIDAEQSSSDDNPKQTCKRKRNPKGKARAKPKAPKQTNDEDNNFISSSSKSESTGESDCHSIKITNEEVSLFYLVVDIIDIEHLIACQ